MKVTAEGGDDSGGEVEADELLLAQELDDGAHEAVKDEHVGGQVDGAVVAEGREEHRGAQRPAGGDTLMNSGKGPSEFAR